MSLLQAIILGIVQGLTEFLPVSSSGHLVLLQKVFGIEIPGLSFDVVLHIGTLIPVIIVFWKDILALLKRPFQKYVLLIIVATVPAVVVSLLFGDVIDKLFETGSLLGLGFIITGVLLMLADRVSGNRGRKNDDDITITDSGIIGVVQAVAICPAISRSGSTIAASLFRGLSRDSAAKFSFILSIPAILGAAVLQILHLLKGNGGAGGISTTAYAGGLVAAALTGYLAITFMLKIIRERKLRYFAYYVFALAVFVFVDQFITGIIF